MPRLARRPRRLRTGGRGRAAQRRGLGGSRPVGPLRRRSRGLPRRLRAGLPRLPRCPRQPWCGPCGDGDRPPSRPVSRGTCRRQRLVRARGSPPRGLSGHTRARLAAALARARPHPRARRDARGPRGPCRRTPSQPALPGGRDRYDGQGPRRSRTDQRRRRRRRPPSAGRGDCDGNRRRSIPAGDDRIRVLATFWTPARRSATSSARSSGWSTHGRPTARSGSPHFASFCRSHYVAILTWCAKYQAAESEIDSMRAGARDDRAGLDGPLRHQAGRGAPPARPTRGCSQAVAAAGRTAARAAPAGLASPRRRRP